MAPIANSQPNGDLYEEVSNLLKLLEETPSVEYKCSETWKSLKFKVVKTALAMGNKRDGGIIIIGVAENGNSWEKTGVSKEHFDTYDADDIKVGYRKGIK